MRRSKRKHSFREVGGIEMPHPVPGQPSEQHELLGDARDRNARGLPSPMLVPQQFNWNDWSDMLSFRTVARALPVSSPMLVPQKFGWNDWSDTLSFCAVARALPVSSPMLLPQQFSRKD